jgi:2-dehydro-3-deoxyphosphogluconate aldolase / (4S)-4-hydroxy-2-oxoglutarate aldolase
MARAELIRELHDSRLVAVLRSKTAEEAMLTAKSAASAGVRFVEVTLSVPGAIGVIEALARESAVRVGAGTVLSKNQAEAAITAGAQFVVSPSSQLDLIAICHGANVAYFPGAATPTEIYAAARAGADLVKIFPADCLGGPNFIRQMAGPFPEVRFMVSGGVSLTNVKEYVHTGVTGICLGSAFLANTLAEQGERGLVNEVKEFVKFIARAKSQL